MQTGFYNEEDRKLANRWCRLIVAIYSSIGLVALVLVLVWPWANEIASLAAVASANSF